MNLYTFIVEAHVTIEAENLEEAVKRAKERTEFDDPPGKCEATGLYTDGPENDDCEVEWKLYELWEAKESAGDE